MLPHPIAFLFGGLLLLTSACAERLPVESAHVNRVTYVTRQQDIRFIPSVDGLNGAEAQRLDRFIRNQAIGYGDHLVLLLPGHDGAYELRERRIRVIEAILAQHGLKLAAVDAPPAAGAPLDEAVLIAGRHVVIPTGCPKTGRGPFDFLSNEPDTNFGCATAANLGHMVADPRDLVQGRAPATGFDGTWAAQAVERYRADRIKQLERLSTQRQGGG